ncbi:MAG: ATP-binding cassette domain-containing protein, partial [Fimbriimonadaceae bacterium]|nr:ATP-binding cassette domain-containing protein [Fimbriimonadaceae bacterium]
AGLTPVAVATVDVSGVVVPRPADAARRHLGLVFQSSALFDYMNVMDNVLFGYRRRHPRASLKDQRAVAEAILDQVGLSGTAHLMPSELSGGMRKRVGVARALILEPAVMLYDEPTTGLDPVTTYALDSLMVDVRDKIGATSLIVSHDLTSVFRVADRIAFLHAGELVFDGPPAGFREADHPAIAELVGKARAEAFRE